MKRVFLMLGALASMSACTHTRPPPGGYWPSPDQGASRRVCDVDSLALERQRLVSESRQYQGSFGPRDGGPPPGYAPPPGDPRDDEVAKMRDFDAEIDAQYRAVTSSCRAYIQCLENSSYDERNCHDARDQWSESQDRFVQLSVRLREIEEQGHRSHYRAGRYGAYGSSIGGFEAPVRYPERGD